MAILPKYFYDINAIVPGNPPKQRWSDEFTDLTSEYIDIVTNKSRHRERTARNIAYSKWLASMYQTFPDGSRVPMVTGKNMLWQVIRVLEAKHSETSYKDWWGNYRDAVFRVFVSPETFIDKATGEYKQWYLLSPEDSYLVNRFEAECLSLPDLTPRDYNGRERFLSADKRLRILRAIPVECCHHLRHETTAGVLPEGL